MLKRTPFHPRTSALCTGLAYKEWAGYAAVANFDRHSEREYFAVRYAAGLLDVSPLYKYDIIGRDAARLLSRVWCRDITTLKVGRATYSAMCDESGQTLDDGVIVRLDEDAYRITSSEPWLFWFERFARGLSVTISDRSDDLAALALQGPRARAILNPLVDEDLDGMRFFRACHTRLGKAEIVITRTGYTGDLGYELWMEPKDALGVWDAIMEEGSSHGIEPMGLDALDVTRIEAGFVLQGVDYVCAARCLIDRLKSSPYEAGLGSTVQLDRAPFVGQAALREEFARGPAWHLVGLELSWPELEALYASYGLPPHLAPIASREPLPLYDPSGQQQIGQVTSSTWSPRLKRYIALGQVKRGLEALGTQLKVEHTVAFERRSVTATVVKSPFYAPKHARSTPSPVRPKQATSTSEVNHG